MSKIKIGNQRICFNAPSHGIIQKSHEKSLFIRFQKGSTTENNIFSREIPILRNGIPIIVLQVCIFGDNQFLCEIVKVEDI